MDFREHGCDPKPPNDNDFLGVTQRHARSNESNKLTHKRKVAAPILGVSQRPARVKKCSALVPTDSAQLQSASQPSSCSEHTRRDTSQKQTPPDASALHTYLRGTVQPPMREHGPRASSLRRCARGKAQGEADRAAATALRPSHSISSQPKSIGALAQNHSVRRLQQRRSATTHARQVARLPPLTQSTSYSRWPNPGLGPASEMLIQR